MTLSKNLFGFSCIAAGLAMPSLLTNNVSADLATVASIGGYALMFFLALMGACICAIRIR